MNAVLNCILLLLYIYFFIHVIMLIFVFKKSWLTACRVKSILQPNANLQPNQRLWFCIVPDAYKTQQCDNWFIAAQTTGLITVCFLGNLSYTIRIVPNSIRIDSRFLKRVSAFEWVPWLSNNLFFVLHRSLTIVRDASGTIKKFNQIFFKAKFFV